MIRWNLRTPLPRLPGLLVLAAALASPVPTSLAGQDGALTVGITREGGVVAGATVEVHRRGELAHRAVTDEAGMAVLRATAVDPLEALRAD